MRSAVAILGGLLVFSLASVAFIQISGNPPDRWPGPAAAAIAIAYGAVFAFLAGYISARLAPRKPLMHAVIFAILLLAMASASYAIQSEGASPWSLIATAVVSIPAALLGGFAHSRRRPQSAVRRA